MIDLDHINDLTSIDTKGQLSWLDNWPNIILESFKKGKNTNVLNEIVTASFKLNYTKKFTQIGICGMGGSGISGEYIQSYMKECDFAVPIILVRDYKLPINFNNGSLLLIVSYSGNTRETLSCLYEALKRNLSVVLITSGGILLEITKKTKIPLVLLQKGFVQRAAFPLLFGAIAGILCKFFPEANFLEYDILKLADLLNHNNFYKPDNPIKFNLAKQLALKLQDRIPIFLSEFACLGMRMKGQMNENSKKMAFYDIFPEMMHNTTQSWVDENLVNCPFHFIRIFIRNSIEMKDKTSYGWELAKYNESDNVDDLDFSKSTDNILLKLLLATYLVDYTSIYLAILRNYDPSKAEIIVGMKLKFDPELTKQFDIKSALFNLV